jgi:hypothetical protein
MSKSKGLDGDTIIRLEFELVIQFDISKMEALPLRPINPHRGEDL